MKWFIGILVGLAALVLVVFVALFIVSGGAKGIGANEASIVISKPASDVYPWIVELEKLKQWIGGLTEMIPMTKGGLQKGAKSKDIIVSGKEKTEMITEVIDFEINQYLRVKITSKGFDLDAIYQLSEDDGKTTLSYIGTTKYKHFVAKLLEPVVTPVVQKKLEVDLAKLKELVEGEENEMMKNEDSEKYEPAIEGV